MRVVVLKSKDGFRVVEADEVRINNTGSVVVFIGEDQTFKVGRHPSWEPEHIEHLLEAEGAHGGPMNLCHLSRDYSKWKEAPF